MSYRGKYSRKSRPSRKSRYSNRRKSFSGPRRPNPKYATKSMPMTDLQHMAKSLGIPFGGLSRTKLVRKINNYY